jgi:hypothetical protein
MLLLALMVPTFNTGSYFAPAAVKLTPSKLTLKAKSKLQAEMS